MKKRILAALLALGCALLVFTGCGSKKDTTPKNYTQIIHDAREAEDNDYYMIFSPAEDGKFTAQYGYSASYPADDLNDAAPPVGPARGQLHRSCCFPLFHDGAELRRCHRQAC